MLREAIGEATSIVTVVPEAPALDLPSQSCREALRGVLAVPLHQLNGGFGPRPDVSAAEIRADSGIGMQAEAVHAETPGREVGAGHERAAMEDRARAKEVAVG